MRTSAAGRNGPDLSGLRNGVRDPRTAGGFGAGAKKLQAQQSGAALGAGTFVFGMLTLLGKLMRFDLRIMYATAAMTFFFAPLACVLGILGIAARVKSPEKRGLPSAIIGLVLGLVFGLLAAYCLVMRVFRA